MSSATKPVFGRRSARAAAPVARAVPVLLRHDDNAAFFATLRASMEETETAVPLAVPRSFRAAFLAGLVVGCALVGFKVTDDAAMGPLAGLAGLGVSPRAMLPALLVIGLVGGARAAAVTVLVVHHILAKAEQSSPMAYAAGGALASGVLAGVMLLALRHAPAHGWAVEIAAGAGSGWLYRVFAGTKPRR